MRNRCSNPRTHEFYLYGGRGIKICEEWSDYKVFHEWAMSHGYEDDLSIERKNNNGNYEPENCEWIPKAKQAGNRQTSVLVKYKGKEKTLAGWSRETGIPYATLWTRIRKQGWSVERALTTPV